MKQVGIIFEFEGSRDVEIGYLIAQGVAVTKCKTNTLYFINVSPADEGGNLYRHVGDIADIAIMNNDDVDLASMPAAALTFAMWAAGKPLPAEVTSVAV